MFELTLRREQTLSRVGEGFAAYNPLTGLFLFPGGTPGWSEAARFHLGEYLEAGLITADGDQYQGGYRGLTLTTAGRYLLARWHKGPAEAIVRLPANLPNLELPEHLLGHTPGVRLDAITYRNQSVYTTDDHGEALVISVIGGYETLPGADPDTCDGNPYRDVTALVITFDLDEQPIVVRLTDPTMVRCLAGALVATVAGR